MPASFPSHAAAVLPLKLWRPRWFDGVALVVGAAIPDLPYAAGCCGPPQTYGHMWWGTILSIPVTLLVGMVLRWAAPVLAVHLPALGPVALRDYGVLGTVRHRWWISAGSAWLGALSHLLWDHLTHESLAGTDIGLAVLGGDAFAGVKWWMILHVSSTIGGAIAWLAMTIHIGRNRLLVRWHGQPPPRPYRPRLFWATAAAAGVIGVAVVAVLAWLARRVEVVAFIAPVPKPSVLVVRAALVGGLALIAGVIAVTRQPAVGDHEQLTRGPQTPASR